MVNKNKTNILFSFFVSTIFILYVLNNFTEDMPETYRLGILITILIISTLVMFILEIFVGKFFPLIKGFRETKILSGFLYNALIVSLVSGFAIYISNYLETTADQDLTGRGPFLKLPFQGGIEAKRTKLAAIIVTSFIFSMFFYLLFHILFGFGESMVVS